MPNEKLQKIDRMIHELRQVTKDTEKLMDKALELHRLNPQTRRTLAEAAHQVAEHFHMGNYGPADLAENQALQKLLRIIDQINDEASDANPS